MKNKNRIIIFLAILGLAFFSFFQFAIIPREKAKEARYISDQKSPRTHDLNSILKFKSKYMGDASNLINLFYSLPLNDIPMTFQLYPDKLVVEIDYKSGISNIGEQKVKEAIIYNSTASFALIDNLQGLVYNFQDKHYSITRNNVEKFYGTKCNLLLEENCWKESVEKPLNDSKYVNNSLESILSRE